MSGQMVACVVTTSPASIPAAAAGPLSFGISDRVYEAKAFGDRFGHRTYPNAGPATFCLHGVSAMPLRR